MNISYDIHMKFKVGFRISGRMQMTVARNQVVNDDEVGYYHCINRCVRRSFLCGFDSTSNTNFDHRKEWVKNRLSHLSSAFMIEIGAYAIMSNHIHLNLKTRPDLVKKLTNEEVLRRWWRLFPPRFQDSEFNIPQEILEIWLQNAEFIDKVRSRLSSISWFMKCLSEYIARKANKEDNVTGRFWEGRFKCQKILDMPSVTKVSAYIDLNPLRAKVTDSLEHSKYASIAERLAAQSNPEIPRSTFLARFDAANTELAQASSFLGIDESEYIEIVRMYANDLLNTSENKEHESPYSEVLHSRFCSHAIGLKSSMIERTKALGKKWIKGIRFGE